MKKLYVLTGNAGKFAEIKRYLESKDLEIEQVDVDLEEIQDVDALKIIQHKAAEALKLGYHDFLIEDTSLYIDGMNRLPGPLIKWFLQELAMPGIYKLAASMGNGAAQVETIFAYVKNPQESHYFRGATGGRIVEPRGEHGFGWSAIFQPDNCLKTYGEMDYEEKSLWNQRIKALSEFKLFWNKHTTQTSP